MHIKVWYSDGEIKLFDVYKTKTFPEHIELYREEEGTKTIQLDDIDQISHFE